MDRQTLVDSRGDRSSSRQPEITAILFNPSSGAGARTLARVDMAAKILGHDHATITNLFPVPTRSVLDVNNVGTEAKLWEAARPGISEALTEATDVLLAYGCHEPVGQARYHFRNQLEWLRGQVEGSGCALWTVSERPRHPSRWQRHTSHHFPEMPFIEALQRSLTRSLGIL